MPKDELAKQGPEDPDLLYHKALVQSDDAYGLALGLHHFIEHLDFDDLKEDQYRGVQGIAAALVRATWDTQRRIVDNERIWSK